MARLASDAKMGYYPTPSRTLDQISRFLEAGREETHLLDPCCGEGEALYSLALSLGQVSTYGVEQDAERAVKASMFIDRIVQGSIFDVRINPLGSMGLLWLNPPYGSEGGERFEMRFLKHSVKWLCQDGILVFLVPESLFDREKDRQWITQNFYDCRIFRFHREDYPRFKQVVLIGKRRAVVGEGEIPPPPYPHIEDEESSLDSPYMVPRTDSPQVFQGTDSVTNEEVLSNRSRLILEVMKLMENEDGLRKIRPLLPLRKGHLVTLLTAGFLDGRVETSEEPIWIKGFSDRTSFTRTEDDKEITCNTYSVGIRVLEEGGKWYDIQ